MSQNQFSLVYRGAITENVPGQVNIHPVAYMLNGIRIAANVYTPAGYECFSDRKYPAVTVAHPNGGVKEQVAGLFAQRLAEMGYVAIAADASYQGESQGEPRQRDYPANRIDDIIVEIHNAGVEMVTIHDRPEGSMLGMYNYIIEVEDEKGITDKTVEKLKAIPEVRCLGVFNVMEVR